MASQPGPQQRSHLQSEETISSKAKADGTLASLPSPSARLQNDFKSNKTMEASSGTESSGQESSQAAKSLEIGVSFRDLTVYGFGTTTDYQKTFINYPAAYLSNLRSIFGPSRKSRIDIIRNFDGLVTSGEMLLLLGRPGSGCSTLLKTIAGYTHGLHVDQASTLNYQGMIHFTQSSSLY